MEYARKMILIPQECLEQKLQPQLHNNDDIVKKPESAVPTTTTTKSSVQTPGTPTTRLDEEMSKIFSSAGNVREKSLRYQQVLQRFLQLKGEEEHDHAIHSHDITAPTPIISDNNNSNDDEHIIESVPPRFRSNARQLIRYLRNVDNIEWNDRGVITVDGDVVKGTNIVDLVNEAMRSRKRPPPRGYAQFAHALHRAGIPREFIGNDKLWLEVASVAPLSSANEGYNTAQTATTSEEDEDDNNSTYVNITKGAATGGVISSRKRIRARKRKKTGEVSATPSIPAKRSRLVPLKWSRI